MPAPISNDLRKRIIEAAARGDKVSTIVREKQVSKSTITRLLRQYRKTGSYDALPLNNGRKSKLTAEQLEQVRCRVVERPDITINELIEEFPLPITESGLGRIVKHKLGFVYKKNDTCGRTRA
jgi:putative transposase